MLADRKHVYIIAEIGCNHNGDPKLAARMVDEAAACGVDAVKFQTFRAESLISRYAPKAEYQKQTTGSAGTQLEMTRSLELSGEDYLALRDRAASLGLGVFSAPFDLESIDFLEASGQVVWKIPSGEITNLPYLERVGAVCIPGKRIILSTGMATVSEVAEALSVLEKAGTVPSSITVLHCNTEYPTPDSDANVSAIAALAREFPGHEVGLSDHTLGSTAAVMAVALGATVVEKHFTLDRSLPGPDHRASVDPKGLRELVASVRRAEAMLGCGEKIVTASEARNRAVARKSIVAARPITAGEEICAGNVICKRPGTGISPMLWYEVLGHPAPRDFGPDELIELPGFPMQGEEEL